MTAKIFRNAFLIGFTVLLACILLFFFIMYSNYQAQAFDNLAIEAEHISEGMQICGGKSYLSAVQSGERITWIAADGSVLYDNMADSSTMETISSGRRSPKPLRPAAAALTGIPPRSWRKTTIMLFC